MSANLDLVRSIYADWERGDFSRGDWADPDIEFVIVGGPDPGEWTGLTSMASAWRDALSATEHDRLRMEVCREIDGQRVLVLARRSRRGKASGVNLGQMMDRGAGLFHIRNGKVTRLVVYYTWEEALNAVGLVE